MTTRLIGMAPQPWNLDIQQLMRVGHLSIDKFGRNDGVSAGPTKQTICEGCAGLYPYAAQNNAETLYISSDNTGDGQVLVVEGLDSTGAFLSQEKTLTGQTPVQLDTDMWRVFRMYQKELGNWGSTDFAGTIYCYTVGTATGGVPSGASVEKSRVNNGNNQTLMMTYTIELGKVGFLYRGEAGIQFNGGASAGTETCELHYRSRRVGSIFKTKKSVDVSSNGSSIFQDYRSFPDIIPALTDLEITKIAASSACAIWATVDILLVDEDIVEGMSPGFLATIGQPSAIPEPS